MPVSRHTAAEKDDAVEMYRTQGPKPPAEKYKVSPSTIVKWAKARNVATVATGTMRAANESRSERLRGIRQELEEEFLLDAKRLRAQLWEPKTYIEHGGKDFSEVTYTLPEPTFAEKRQIMSAASTAVTSSARLAAADKDTTSMEDANNIIDLLLGELGVDDSVNDIDYSTGEEVTYEDEITDGDGNEIEFSDAE